MQENMKTIRPYWQQTKKLTGILLLVWCLLTFSVLFFARELASLHFFGWPFSFYMAAQGLTLMYVLIIGIFSFYAHRIEQSHLNRIADASEDAS
jgi:putative solute:sodium symporter small subunit